MGKLRCKAFELIPNDIFTNQVSHLKPHEGDNGILFEAAPGVEEPTIAEQILAAPAVPDVELE